MGSTSLLWLSTNVTLLATTIEIDKKKKINSDTKYMRDIYHDKLLLINPYSAAEGCQCLPLHSGPRTDAIEKSYGARLVFP